MSGASAPRAPRYAFTLVELLVVIGIIAVLIAILLPSLQKVRQQALKVQDLSNCRQIVNALTNYASTFKGNYPRGTRESGYDDLAWMNADTFDYLLQYTSNDSNATATDIASYPTRKDVLSCNSALLTNPAGSMFSTVSYKSAYHAMQAGWIYFGNRRISNTATNSVPQPAIMNDDGTFTGEIYQMPNKAGQKATTRTLVTCFSYNVSGYSAYIPHRAHAGYTSGSTVYSKVVSNIKPIIDGLVVGCTDGSARFVPGGELGVLMFPNNGAQAIYFYDSQAR